jgi:alkylation response protein AidB-like acyl-CoA dehydrogenase
MQALFDLTLDYAKTRRQFGRAIGSFQTIQFRLVDLWIRLDEARSLLITATMAADEGHAEARKLTAAAWIQTLWSGRAISEEAIQIHGAIGMTEEYAVGRYVKRILVNELMFGPAEPHLARYRSSAAA